MVWLYSPFLFALPEHWDKAADPLLQQICRQDAYSSYLQLQSGPFDTLFTQALLNSLPWGWGKAAADRWHPVQQIIGKSQSVLHIQNWTWASPKFGLDNHMLKFSTALTHVPECNSTWFLGTMSSIPTSLKRSLLVFLSWLDQALHPVSGQAHACEHTISLQATDVSRVDTRTRILLQGIKPKTNWIVPTIYL